jgi:[ribosomal protein S5]-alanine N-acetyltransferase
MLSAYCGKGFMTMAMRMAINFGQKTIGLNHIAATTTKQNIKAVKLLERLNFVQVSGYSVDEIAFELISK